MITKLVLIVLIIYFSSTNAYYKSYENYKIYKVIPSDQTQVEVLKKLQEDGVYDFWDDIIKVGEKVRILVAPDQENKFQEYLTSKDIEMNVAIRNVQDVINNQMKPSKTRLSNTRSSSLGSMTWDRYHSMEEIDAWLDELEELYPNVVKTVVIGKTYEERDIKGVIIDYKPNQRGNNTLTGMFEGGIHSREWISPATVTWVIKEFLTSTDPDIRFMAETFVWHMFPVVNPDGYAYTFTGDRMWRKNRNPENHVACGSDLDIGNGIDLNRNFNYLWMTTGASTNPCTEVYAGPTGGSELETQAISNYVLQLDRRSNLLYYFAFHSYTQLILIPFSHLSRGNVLEVNNYADLYEISVRGVQKLSEVHGTTYTAGTSAEILYAVSGSSFDWVKGVVGVPIVVLFELRDTGEFGFLLETEQIIPNNEEIMASLVEMDKTTRSLRYYNTANGVSSSVMIIVASLVYLGLQ